VDGEERLARDRVHGPGERGADTEEVAQERSSGQVAPRDDEDYSGEGQQDAAKPSRTHGLPQRGRREQCREQRGEVHEQRRVGRRRKGDPADQAEVEARAAGDPDHGDGEPLARAQSRPPPGQAEPDQHDGGRDETSEGDQGQWRDVGQNGLDPTVAPGPQEDDDEDRGRDGGQRASGVSGPRVAGRRLNPPPHRPPPAIQRRVFMSSGKFDEKE
jgi:hypothetical protein